LLSAGPIFPSSRLEAAAKPKTKAQVSHDELLQNEKFTGDLDGIRKRRIIRALVVYNDLLYFFAQGRPHGASYESLKLFEKFINQKLKTGTVKLHVVFIPTTRNRIIADLAAGYGDIAAANLTITPGRLKQVDFSQPLIKNVREILITGPKAPKITHLEGLSGHKIMVRKASSYYEHLQELNHKLKKAGKKPVTIEPAPIYLEDGDLLDMVNSGILPWAIVDEHKARLWVQIHDKLTPHPDLVLHEGGQIAWALRKNCPKFKHLVNQFVKAHRQGTLLGNIIIKRYMKDNKWVKNPNRAKERKRFEQTVKLFREYGHRYHFDYLMLMALAFQESQLDQSKRSPAGAIGIMQLLKKTAADPNIAIPDIEKLEKNIAAGSKYLRFLYDRYYAKDQKIDKLNKMLFTFASYNAGPRRIMQMRKLAARMGLDPNVWFQNVELAAAKKIGRETVQYVSNIYKYYIAYRLVEEQKKTGHKAGF
jgi:membrane-bound lytic murein transglycosylase MltF